MRNRLIMLVGAVCVVTSVWFAGGRGLFGQQEDERQLTQRDFMRTKLMYTQNILEGLSMKRLELISKAATDIDEITRAENWVAEGVPEFERMSEELRQATVHLKKAADSGNLEAATLRYFELTLKCIDCHQHLRKADF